MRYADNMRKIQMIINLDIKSLSRGVRSRDFVVVSVRCVCVCVSRTTPSSNGQMSQ